MMHRVEDEDDEAAHDHSEEHHEQWGYGGDGAYAGSDWNGDAEFDTSDLTYAFIWGGYEASAASAVPEPSTIKLCIVLLTSLTFFHRRR